MSELERLAVIDLGSNSFRLVVFSASGVGQEGGWWRRTDEIYQAVRLAEGMSASGRLEPEPCERALAALEVFAHFCSAAGLGAGEIDAVATSAVREAANRDEFLERARRRSGLAIRVLSREEEAHYGFLAALNSTTLTDGYVLELGGGSVQLVQVAGRRERAWGSWPLGAVSMTERFLPGSGPAKHRQIERLRAHVSEQLSAQPWIGAGAPRDAGCGDGEGDRPGRPRLVGMGGAIRNLADAVQHLAGLPASGVQGAVIGAEALAELVERLTAMSVSERARLPGIKPARADVILAGAVVVRSVLELTGAARVEVTEAGLREGVFFASHQPAEGGPLFDDVRRAGVLNLAARYGADVAHTRHVAALALSMFDQLAALGLHPGEPVERELLWAACMLHDIGVTVDYDDHHKHSRYLILNAGLPGFEPREVAIVAQAARYHRKDMPSLGPLRPLFGKGDRERLERCSVLLRLAEDLERSRDQTVREASLSASNGHVVLRLEGERVTAVPRWAASRERELFSRAFGRDLAVRG
ncbi:MAG: Ppx/GppA family phosphatase [Acidobacteriota bacterium]|nr:Ppx/GppA family phosphatase [Acidobacteriota bacterium]